MHTVEMDALRLEDSTEAETLSSGPPQTPLPSRQINDKMRDRHAGYISPQSPDDFKTCCDLCSEVRRTLYQIHLMQIIRPDPQSKEAGA